MGIVAAGSGFGTLIFSLLAALLISVYSWRTSYIILGIIALIIVIGSAILIRNSPADMGLSPFGAVHGSETKKVISLNNTQETQRQFTLRQAIGTPPFWQLIIIFMSLCISLQMVMVHLIPYATDMGIDKKVSAMFLALIGGCSAPVV